MRGYFSNLSSTNLNNKFSNKNYNNSFLDNKKLNLSFSKYSTTSFSFNSTSSSSSFSNSFSPFGSKLNNLKANNYYNIKEEDKEEDKDDDDSSSSDEEEKDSSSDEDEDEDDDDQTIISDKINKKNKNIKNSSFSLSSTASSASTTSSSLSSSSNNSSSTPFTITSYNSNNTIVIDCIAAIDQGTSSSRVLIISKQGEILGSAQLEHHQYYPSPGYVEHDPYEILGNVVKCMNNAVENTLKNIENDEKIKNKYLKSSNSSSSNTSNSSSTSPNNLTIKVNGIGITNQRETTTMWNKKTGKIYHRSIVWNDTRTNNIIKSILKEKFNNNIGFYQDRTGLPLASYFSISKILYLLENVPEIKEDIKKGEVCFGTIDTWLIWNLTKNHQHVTDVTNASRTYLMNLHNLSWDNVILNDFNINPNILPKILPSSSYFGELKESIYLNNIEESVPLNPHYHNVSITGVMGDQNSALFGQVGFNFGDVKITYGTGAFVLFNTGEEIIQSKHGLLSTVAYQLGNKKLNQKERGEGGESDDQEKPSKPIYALEGSVAYSGATIQWLRDNLKLIASASEVEALALDLGESNDGVYFVPAFAGLYAPYWREDARGTITGLTGFSDTRHFVRGALEATAFQVKVVLDTMLKDIENRSKNNDDSHIKYKSKYIHKPNTTKMPNKSTNFLQNGIKIDGGLSVNNFLMQFQSDLLGVPILRPQTIETTALGVAMMAGLTVGLWKDLDELKQLWKEEKKWIPSMPLEKKKTLMRGWNKAVSRSLYWKETDNNSVDPFLAILNVDAEKEEKEKEMKEKEIELLNEKIRELENILKRINFFLNEEEYLNNIRLIKNNNNNNYLRGLIQSIIKPYISSSNSSPSTPSSVTFTSTSATISSDSFDQSYTLKSYLLKSNTHSSIKKRKRLSNLPSSTHLTKTSSSPSVSTNPLTYSNSSKSPPGIHLKEVDSVIKETKRRFNISYEKYFNNKLLKKINENNLDMGKILNNSSVSKSSTSTTSSSSYNGQKIILNKNSSYFFLKKFLYFSLGITSIGFIYFYDKLPQEKNNKDKDSKDSKDSKDGKDKENVNRFFASPSQSISSNSHSTTSNHPSNVSIHIPSSSESIIPSSSSSPLIYPKKCGW